MGPRGCPTFWRSVEPKKCEGAEGPPRERRASGVSCCVRRPLGNYTPKVAVFAHPTDAAGTKGDFEGETTSIETSFYFHPLKSRELSKIHAR